MNILLSTLREELRTVQRLEKKYSQALLKLPTGSFVLRNIKDKKYGYLTYRDGNAVRQKYLGKLNEEEIKQYRDISKRRKDLKTKLKSIREQKKILERALREKAK
jgi:hypothetical protein